MTQEQVRALALRCLDRRDYSEQELYDKLIEKGAGEQQAAECLAALVSIGFVDDSRYAAQIVRHYAAAGMGLRRIRAELQRRRVERSLWDEALENIPDPTETLDKLLQQKLKGAAPEGQPLKRAVDYLARRGYSWDEINECVERYKTIRESEE